MNITNPTDLLNRSREVISQRAFETFQKHLPEIEVIKHSIEHNRKGDVDLLAITKDEKRLNARFSREGGLKSKAIERINGVPNFQDISVIKKIVRSASSICRINIQNNFGGTGYGTGFHIGNNIIVTNNHVIPDEETAARATAQFNYELDEHGNFLNPVVFNMRPDYFFLTAPFDHDPEIKESGLDFTLVALEPTSQSGMTVESFGLIRLDGGLGKIIEGENCVVIQHPSGDYKKIVLKDIRMLTLTDKFLLYESDTLPGSSGSPVYGLGTGEVVAIHHCSIPRKDMNGNWLRKDGTIASGHDHDKAIDWMGNEGVRVSCLMEAIATMPLPDHMVSVRAELLQSHKGNTARKLTTLTETNMNQLIDVMPATNGKGTAIHDAPPGALLHFEVLVSSDLTLQEDWEKNYSNLIAGLRQKNPVLTTATDSTSRRMQYLAITSSENPWKLAERIENLPHIEWCIPDLEMLTDAGVSEEDPGVSKFESVIYNTGIAKPNEDEFLAKWKDTLWLKSAKQMNDNAKQTNANYHRWWNWLAVNCPKDDTRNTDTWKAIIKNMERLRYVQLDTGYTRHTKSFDGLDLTKDFDFIENDHDASEMLKNLNDRLLLKHPSHGTRTSSVTVGYKLREDPTKIDGNSGLLVFNGRVPCRLIPYRIAKSVILLGRAKELVDSVSYAIKNNTDVMFMCMGTYPKPMIEAAAKAAYENGLIWVCAAGNEVGEVVAPALYPGTIAVGATNPDDKPWRGSSRGDAVDICAPGEHVYVPFVNDKGNEIMVYGDGTSYATPHVASAAVLWKAKNIDAIKEKYTQPWQVVEAFRRTIRQTAREKRSWSKTYPGNGAGILDIEAVLRYDLPNVESLVNAYKDKPYYKSKDLGLREAGHFFWNVAKGKLRGSAEALTSSALTDRGRITLAAFSTRTSDNGKESTTSGTLNADLLLKTFFA